MYIDEHHQIGQVLRFIYQGAGINKIFNLFKETHASSDGLLDSSQLSKDLADFGLGDISNDSISEEKATTAEDATREDKSLLKLDVRDCSRLAFLDNYEFADIRENCPGNYLNYVYKVLRMVKRFDYIDFSDEIEERSIVLPNLNNDKYTLFLDLDETLIHSDFARNYDNPDHVIRMDHENEVHEIPLLIRPWLNEFLVRAHENYNIIVFTAGRKEYADAVLDFLDPLNQLFCFRFYRDHCIPVRGKVYVKDLRIIQNLDFSKTVIVDNSMFSFSNQLRNGVLVSSFFNNKEDRELMNLLNYLNYLTKVDDVRKVNEEVFHFEDVKSQIEFECDFYNNF